MANKRSDRGAAAVEFALVLPVLVALLLGIIEFGYAMYVQATIAGAAREGARALAINTSSTASAQSVAMQAALPAVTLNSSEISADSSLCSTANPSAAVTVKINYPYSGIAGLLPHSITITGTGVMRCGG